MRRAAPLALVALFGADGFAAEPDPACADKSGFSLVHRTPAACLRPLSTDRPDQTESPYTVDAGHVQIEADLASAAFDDAGPISATTWSVASVNAKVGLRNHVDLQLVLDSYVDARLSHDASSTTDEASGIGDLTARIKINAWGNDGGRTALAVMPYVKLPLPESEIRNGRVEAGVIVPFAVALAERWGMSLMTEVDFVAPTAAGYETAWVNSISVSTDLTRRLGMYAELFTVAASGRPWRGQADAGFTLAFGESIQLDWGCNFGITESAPDFNPFLGLAARF